MASILDVFELEKPESFTDLLSQIELISNELKKWTEKIISTNIIARQNREIISESDTNDAFHNMVQNIIALSKLILKKLKEA